MIVILYGIQRQKLGKHTNQSLDSNSRIQVTREDDTWQKYSNRQK